MQMHLSGETCCIVFLPLRRKLGPDCILHYLGIQTMMHLLGESITTANLRAAAALRTCLFWNAVYWQT